MADPTARRSRLGLILVAVLFVGPMLAAVVAYKSGWAPVGQTANGQLLSPVRPSPDVALLDVDGQLLPAETLRGKWTLLYLGDNHCAEGCQQALYHMRQVWKSLGRQRKRVQGVYLLSAAQPDDELRAFMAAEHQGMTLARVPAADSQWLDFLALDGSIAPLQTDNIYILDPLGNWVLYYRPQDPPKGLLKDLKKLLKLSQIG